ncbi:sensor histidine kinase [Spirilliplanes yamanashiensis]|uniref:histidine kinase n=1 Tax=Spirilliplanes yamanashiensis TaxID=42233 RepID=A0A8J4DLS9_9ACTN|nr:histidine kinase [Spirilliplanes yamanashiensis]MDP9818960.1 signal transduction histidine kinase [Spirilliplanes yamanashiensis]GIJ05415.1 hypothetical protein Sya03_47670 [Spirilliplanes yamanashiensis]
MPRVLAYTAAVVAVLLAAAGAGLAVASGEPGAGWYVAGGAVLGAASVALGLLVAHRRPRNAVGPLLVLVGLVPIWLTGSDLYEAAAANSPALRPVLEPVLALHDGDWMWLYVPPALLALHFPDGRLPGPRWRWVAAGLIAVPAAFTLLVAGDPAAEGPRLYTLPGWALWPALALLPVLLGLLVATAASMVQRYRRADDPVRRAQVRWFALGALFVPATLLTCWLSYLLLSGPDLVLAGLAATYLAVPAATAVAVLRHDLYDVDRALSGAIRYGILSAALLAFWTAATVVGGLALGRQSVPAAVAATTACALALAPLRTRLRRWVDRRFYPRREAALSAIDELRRRTHDGAARPEELGAVLRTALRDEHLRVGYRVPGVAAVVDADGHPLARGDDPAVPVLLGGTEIGVLTYRSAGSRELLREVAAAAALLVEVVRLRLELGVALREVASSRSRLLTVSYEERRRLERDLHDGAQQRLVSLGMALRLGQRHLDTTDVDALIDSAVAELGAAVAELRQIAHGLRPSSLDDGLANALTMLAGRVPAAVELELPPDLRAEALPDVVTTTAYYVASEAVANAVKHARAASIGLRVERGADRLTVRIRDDGCGGALLRPGAGLAGLADRVAAAGGGLVLTSPAGRGTVVEAHLPVAG